MVLMVNSESLSKLQKFKEKDLESLQPVISPSGLSITSWCPANKWKFFAKRYHTGKVAEYIFCLFFEDLFMCIVNRER